MSTNSKPEGQLTKFRSRAELLHWVEDQTAADIVPVIRTIFLFANDAKFADVWYWIQDWAKQVGLTKEQVRPVYNKAALEVAEHKERQKQTREAKQRAEEARRAVLRDRLLAEGYCKSLSHAYLLARSPKTTDEALAAIMAEELGGVWVSYYRRPNKSGPRSNIVKRLMQLRQSNATFADFIEYGNPPDALADVAQIMARRDQEHFGAYYADESEFISIADARGVDTDRARLLWSHYEEWAVDIVAGHATQLVRMSRKSIEEKLYPFG